MTTAGPKIARIRRRPAILWVDVGTVTFTIVPVTSLKFCCHIKWLVNAFPAHKQPFHEGKYATPLAIAGVADISFLAKNFQAVKKYAALLPADRLRHVDQLELHYHCDILQMIYIDNFVFIGLTLSNVKRSRFR
ncbi:hypothetical protein EUGRSUZ_G02526 [Eucalyptus grandis]|uniref:Uncharacterized protein n=2 Tax=Eucalyptus grandis TaxID=71139 RepID=A0ACC3K619_EUCGR|nr:hypothetical protein EUGRSUZ_G02526 [Eucalyptus grandis]